MKPEKVLIMKNVRIENTSIKLFKNYVYALWHQSLFLTFRN